MQKGRNNKEKEWNNLIPNEIVFGWEKSGKFRGGKLDKLKLEYKKTVWSKWHASCT